MRAYTVDGPGKGIIKSEYSMLCGFQKGRMVDLTRYDGRTFALLLCGETESGEDNWVVFPGVARMRGNSLYLERPGDAPQVEIRPEWYERIKPTNDKSREILLGADYYLALTVGNISDDEAEGLERIGLKWPKENETLEFR